MSLASNTATHSVEIDAAPDRVWATLRDFGRVAEWHPIASASRLVAGHEGQPGAERELSLADGGAVRERLVRMDDRSRMLAYEMTTYPIPVVAQENTIGVDAGSNAARSRVTFSARFTPAPGHASDEVRSINEEAFRAAADGLARHLARGAGAL